MYVRSQKHEELTILFEKDVFTTFCGSLEGRTYLISRFRDLENIVGNDFTSQQALEYLRHLVIEGTIPLQELIEHVSEFEQTMEIRNTFRKFAERQFGTTFEQIRIQLARSGFFNNAGIEEDISDDQLLGILLQMVHDQFQRERHNAQGASSPTGAISTSTADVVPVGFFNTTDSQPNAQGERNGIPLGDAEATLNAMEEEIRDRVRAQSEEMHAHIAASFDRIESEQQTLRQERVKEADPLTEEISAQITDENKRFRQDIDDSVSNMRQQIHQSTEQLQGEIQSELDRIRQEISDIQSRDNAERAIGDENIRQQVEAKEREVKARFALWEGVDMQALESLCNAAWDTRFEDLFGSVLTSDDLKRHVLSPGRVDTAVMRRVQSEVATRMTDTVFQRPEYIHFFRTPLGISLLVGNGLLNQGEAQELANTRDSSRAIEITGHIQESFRKRSPDEQRTFVENLYHALRTGTRREWRSSAAKGAGYWRNFIFQCVWSHNTPSQKCSCGVE
jgi:hypothetical protein